MIKHNFYILKGACAVEDTWELRKAVASRKHRHMGQERGRHFLETLIRAGVTGVRFCQILWERAWL